jgi:hypothetical protein
VASLNELGHGIVRAGRRIEALARRADVAEEPDEELRRIESDELPDAAEDLFIFGHTLRRLARDAHGLT